MCACKPAGRGSIKAETSPDEPFVHMGRDSASSPCPTVREPVGQDSFIDAALTSAASVYVRAV